MKRMPLERLWNRVRRWADQNGHTHDVAQVHGVGAL